MSDNAALKEENLSYRAGLKDRNRIVVKVGSSSLMHPQTQRLDYYRIDTLARQLSDLRNQGKEVILVSSGAAAAGREALKINLDVYHSQSPMNIKQACAAVGQARLIQIYQRFFEDYGQTTAQILMTRRNIADKDSRVNLENTFSELLRLGCIPIVNENDSVATAEFSVGDNDTLSALVAGAVHADLLILLSDVEGLYTDDPRVTPDARFVPFIADLTRSYLQMGKSSTGSGAGTGGMRTKLHAAMIAGACGCDMLIAGAGTSRGMGIIHDIMAGENVGTLFASKKEEGFRLEDYTDIFEE